MIFVTLLPNCFFLGAALDLQLPFQTRVPLAFSSRNFRGFTSPFKVLYNFGAGSASLGDLQGVKSDQKDSDSLPQGNPTEGVEKHLFPNGPFWHRKYWGMTLHDQGTSQASDSTSYLTFLSLF